MIDRINRPDAPEPWKIKRAKETKENQHHKGDREQKGKKKEQPEQAEEWKKYDSGETYIKPIRVKRASIERCLFKGADLHSGIALLEVDITWVDGKTINDAILLLYNLEDYFKVKNFKTGENVPDQYWGREKYVEVGIPQKVHKSGLYRPETDRVQKVEKQEESLFKKILGTIGLIDRHTGEFQTTIAFIYLFFFVVLLLLLILEISK